MFQGPFQIGTHTVTFRGILGLNQEFNPPLNLSIKTVSQYFYTLHSFFLLLLNLYCFIVYFCAHYCIVLSLSLHSLSESIRFNLLTLLVLYPFTFSTSRHIQHSLFFLDFTEKHMKHSVLVLDRYCQVSICYI